MRTSNCRKFNILPKHVMVSKELKQQMDMTDKLVEEVSIRLKWFDESTWLARKLIKYKDESYISAFIDFINRKCDIMPIFRRFFSKRYIRNIYNAIIDNGSYDYNKMSRNFDYELVGKIVPNIIKKVSEYCDTKETMYNDKPLNELFDDLLSTWETLLMYMNDEDDISKEMDKLSWKTDRDKKMELAQKHKDEITELYKSYWNKLWYLLPHMRT